MKFRSIAVCLAALMLSSTLAAAQDWKGFYAGVSAGGADDNDTWRTDAYGDNADLAKGRLLGFQAGYNWQFNSTIVGLEGDYLFSNLQSSWACPDGTNTCGHNLNGLGSLRGRIGWLGSPRAMIYFTGGPAWGSMKWSMLDSAGTTASGGGLASHTMTGFAAGGGLEVMLANHWSMKGEYLHYAFGNYTPATTADFGGTPPTFRYYTDTYKLGLNYKF